MIKAVLFDLDGTMVNTEHLWGDINHKLAASYGVVFDEKVRVRMMGRKDADSLSIFREYYQLSVPVEELISVRREMILSDLSTVKIHKGLYELLDLLERMQIKKAVATSSFREFAARILAMFELTNRFETVITGDDVAISKPNPAIFLETAKTIGVPPGDCLVLEDAENGVEAGYNAGMKVIAIPHVHSSHHDFSKATKIVTSMEEIDESLLQVL